MVEMAMVPRLQTRRDFGKSPWRVEVIEISFRSETIFYYLVYDGMQKQTERSGAERGGAAAEWRRQFLLCGL